MSQAKEITYEKEPEAAEGKPTTTQQKIKKLRKKLKKCQQEKQEYLAGWQRSQADFINYKKDWERKLANWQKMTTGELISGLLPVLDSLTAIDLQKTTDQKIIEGIEGIRKQFLEILKKRGLEEIKSVGQVFNPDFHEVVETVKPKKGQKEGVIVEEIQRGYKIGDKVIRPAKVKIVK